MWPYRKRMLSGFSCLNGFQSQFLSIFLPLSLSFCFSLRAKGYVCVCVCVYFSAERNVSVKMIILWVGSIPPCGSLQMYFQMAANAWAWTPAVGVVGWVRPYRSWPRSPWIPWLITQQPITFPLNLFIVSITHRGAGTDKSDGNSNSI